MPPYVKPGLENLWSVMERGDAMRWPALACWACAVWCWHIVMWPLCDLQ